MNSLNRITKIVWDTEALAYLISAFIRYISVVSIVNVSSFLMTGYHVT